MQKVAFRAACARALVFAASLTACASALAGTTGGFASRVVNYYQGTGLPKNYFNNPNAALHAPTGVIGQGTAFENVLDPFDPAFGKNEIFVMGKGGFLTLQLSSAITVANKPQIGVISNVGIIDTPFGAGKAGNPASIFGGGIVDVRVSDGHHWKDLGNVTFNLPASYWEKLNHPYESAPQAGDVAANLAKPFTGKLSNFNGESLNQILGTLNGSIGGTWLNVSKTGLKTVDYIQFRNPLPTPWVPSNPSQFAIDAVTEAASSGSGSGGGSSAVPLPPAAPAAVAVMGAVAAMQFLRRRLAI